MKEDSLKKTANVLPHERTHFQYMIAKNPNYFGNIPNSKYKENIKLITDIVYEQLTCVGYNPDTTNMEATFSIKKPVGYAGDLCTSGSFEHIRFYLDFHDGLGFIDQGSIAINVHDIPAETDCKGEPIFPIKYVATLKKKTAKVSSCETPILPTLRAILSWSVTPPADTPNWKPVWGNVLDGDVQLKPFWKFPFPKAIDLSAYFTLATTSPHLSTQQIAEITQIDINQLIEPPIYLSPSLLAKKYEHSKIPASRFAFKEIYHMAKYPSSEITMMDKALLADLEINVNAVLDQIGVIFPKEQTEANVDYEELECLGFDYNTENLVATIKIKKENGYSGDLCHAGSKEYISFWIDWDDNCSWQYLNTVALNVHDIDMLGDDIFYSVSLPLDTTYHKKACSIPNIIRARAVLSWNIPPSLTNPDKLEFYGNRKDAHIQLKPGISIFPGEVIPLFNIIGGVDVAHVNDITGLTTPDAFFAFNGLSVPTYAPFGGLIVLNGPSFPGYRYRIKVSNLSKGTFTYADNSFTVVGYLPFAPWVQYTTQEVDTDGYYPFLNAEKNTLNVLARINPGTEDKYQFEIEVDTIFGVFSKTIQMDNTYPDIKLHVDDGGECTHYSKGDTITGHYFVDDLHISSWGFGSTWGGNINGTTNTPASPGTPFSIATIENAYPCGSISLWAIDKTIYDSQNVGWYRFTSYNICLQEKNMT